MEELDFVHIFILVIITLVVLIVILKQIGIRVELSQLFQDLLEFLPRDRKQYDEMEGDYTSLRANKEVTEQLQRYIEANEHLAPNFDIIKDIVERTSDELDERVRTLLSIPLYYGLCGTIFGIILGLVPLIFLDPSDLMYNISLLLGGVAIAMLGSLVGILISSTSHTRYKEVSRQHEACKRMFFNWFQVERLPVIGSNPAGPIGQLIRSLNSFNQDFATNAMLMQSTAQEIGETFETQRQLLALSQELANPAALQQNLLLTQQMGRHVDVIRSFNDSIEGMQDYVEKLREATEGLQSSAEYLGLVKQLVAHFNENHKSIEHVSGALAKHVADVHSQQQQVIDRSLEKIKEQNAFVVGEFKKHLDDLAHSLDKHLSKPGTLPGALAELAKLPAAIEALTEVGKGNQQQMQMLGEVINRIEKRTKSNPPRTTPTPPTETSNPTQGPSNDQKPDGDPEKPAEPTPAKHKSFWRKLKDLFNRRDEDKHPISDQNEQEG